MASGPNEKRKLFVFPLNYTFPVDVKMYPYSGYTISCVPQVTSYLPLLTSLRYTERLLGVYYSFPTFISCKLDVESVPSATAVLPFHFV